MLRRRPAPSAVLAVGLALAVTARTSELLRQYSPNKTDLSLITSETLAASVAELNQRPRAALAWQSPLEVYNRSAVALAA